MILIDTSVWIDHLRAHESELARLIDAEAVCAHPYIIGEIALSQLRQRAIVLKSLQALPQAAATSDAEVFHFLTRHALFGRGVGYVVVCLLAAAALTPNVWLWTRDKSWRPSRPTSVSQPPRPSFRNG